MDQYDSMQFLNKYERHISSTYRERINRILIDLDIETIHRAFILFGLRYTLNTDENSYIPSVEQIRDVVKYGLEKIVYFSNDIRYRGFVLQYGHFSFYYENKHGEEYFNAAFMPKQSIYAIYDNGTEGFEMWDKIVNIVDPDLA